MEREFPTLFRIWHWLTAIATLGLLGTVALRKSFLSWRTNSAVIQSELARLGTEVDADQAKVVAKAIRAPMWEWHYIFGALLGAAVLLRIYLLVRGVKKPAIARILKAADGHERLKALVYTAITFVLLFMAISGGFLYFHEALGVGDDLAHEVKEIHEYAMFSVAGLTVAHLVGVVAHEIRTRESIISRMIHGD